MPKLKPAAVIDFVERVASTAILAGYAAYIVLPHTNTRADLKVAAAAAIGSAVKYIVKAVGAFQAKQPAAQQL